MKMFKENRVTEANLSKLFEVALPVPSKTDEEWKAMEESIITMISQEMSSEGSFKQQSKWNFAVAASITLISAVTLWTALVGGLNRHKPSNCSQINKQTIQKSSIVNHVVSIYANADTVLQLGKSSFIDVAMGTSIKIEEKSSTEIEVVLTEGSIFATIEKKSKDRLFRINTPNSKIVIVGTAFSIEAKGSDYTKLSVLHGDVFISSAKVNSSDSTHVLTGNAITVTDGKLSKKIKLNSKKMASMAVDELHLLSKFDDDIAKGVVEITTLPANASIFVDDKFRGNTPKSLVLNEGEHRLKLHLKNLNDINKVVTVSKNRLTELSLQFKSKIAKKQKSDIAPKIEAKRPATKDFGFIYNSSFVDALSYITIGKYREALVILDSLKSLPVISTTEKFRISSKISYCYKSMGNFDKTLEKMQLKYRQTTDPERKSNLLWEIINIRANCLADYNGAETDILTYISNYPNGPWVEQAYQKLGEVQYLQGKYTKAVGTYQYHITHFKNSKNRDISLYTLANIMRLDIKDYKHAVKFYDELLTNYPSSKFFENAMFEKAQCYDNMKDKTKAVEIYADYMKRYPEGNLRSLCQIKLNRRCN